MGSAYNNNNNYIADARGVKARGRRTHPHFKGFDIGNINTILTNIKILNLKHILNTDSK